MAEGFESGAVVILSARAWFGGEEIDDPRAVIEKYYLRGPYRDGLSRLLDRLIHADESPALEIGVMVNGE